MVASYQNKTIEDEKFKKWKDNSGKRGGRGLGAGPGKPRAVARVGVKNSTLLSFDDGEQEL